MRKEKEKKIDGTLLVTVWILLGLGLVILYSASAYNGRVRFHDPAYYFKKQLFASALGVIGMYAVAKIDYRRLFALAPWFYAASLALSTAVLFFGSEYNGSKRWLKLGPLSFQPSEFAKMAVILFLPWVMEHTKGRSDSLWFMTKAVLCTLPIAALVGSNNLSTAGLPCRSRGTPIKKAEKRCRTGTKRECNAYRKKRGRMGENRWEYIRFSAEGGFAER